MNASPAVTWGIAGMGLFCAAALIAGSALACRPNLLRIALGTAAWLGLTSVVAGRGILAQFDATPPPLALLMLAVFLLAFRLGFSQTGRALANLPLWALIGVQGFRLPLELIMHRAAEEGVMPRQMSYSGCNFDIVTGAGALLVAALVYAGRAPAWLPRAWNAIGILTLSVIVTVALASTPMIAAFGNAPEKLNTWVAWFPFVWLPASCVLFAIAGHIVITRRLGLF